MYQYGKLYNHHIPQKNIGHITPVEALKNWQQKRPELFNKTVYKQQRPDINTKNKHLWLWIAEQARYDKGVG